MHSGIAVDRCDHCSGSSLLSIAMIAEIDGSSIPVIVIAVIFTDLLIGCGEKIKIVRDFEVKLCGEKRQLCGIAQFFFHKKSLVKCCNKLAPAELNPTVQTVAISN